MKSVSKLLSLVLLCWCCASVVVAQNPTTTAPTLNLEITNSNYTPVDYQNRWHVVAVNSNNYTFTPSELPLNSDPVMSDSVPTSDGYELYYTQYIYSEGLYTYNTNDYERPILISNLRNINSAQTVSISYKYKITTQTKKDSWKWTDEKRDKATLNESGSWENTDSISSDSSNPVSIQFYAEPNPSATVDVNDFKNFTNTNVWHDESHTFSYSENGGCDQWNSYIKIGNNDQDNGKSFQFQNPGDTEESYQTPKSVTVEIYMQAKSPDSKNNWGDPYNVTKTFFVWSLPKLEHENQKFSDSNHPYEMFYMNKYNQYNKLDLATNYTDRKVLPNFKWKYSDTNVEPSYSPDKSIARVYYNKRPDSSYSDVTVKVTLTEKPEEYMEGKEDSLYYYIRFYNKPLPEQNYYLSPVFEGKNAKENPEITVYYRGKDLTKIPYSDLDWSYGWENDPNNHTSEGSFSGSTLGENPLNVTVLKDFSDGSTYESDSVQKFSQTLTFNYKVFSKPVVQMSTTPGRYVLADTPCHYKVTQDVSQEYGSTFNGFWNNESQKNNSEFEYTPTLEVGDLPAQGYKTDIVTYAWKNVIEHGLKDSIENTLNHELRVCPKPSLDIANLNENTIITCGGDSTYIGINESGGYPGGWSFKVYKKIENVGDSLVSDNESPNIIIPNEAESGYEEHPYWIVASNYVPDVNGADSVNWFQKDSLKINVKVYGRPRFKDSSLKGFARDTTLNTYYGIPLSNISFDVVGGYTDADGNSEWEYKLKRLFTRGNLPVSETLHNIEKNITINTDSQDSDADSTKVRFILTAVNKYGETSWGHDYIVFNYNVYSIGKMTYKPGPQQKAIYGSTEIGNSDAILHDTLSLDLKTAGGYGDGWKYKWTIPVESQEYISFVDSVSKDNRNGSQRQIVGTNNTGEMKTVTIHYMAMNSIPGLRAEDQADSVKADGNITFDVYPQAQSSSPEAEALRSINRYFGNQDTINISASGGDIDKWSFELFSLDDDKKIIEHYVNVERDSLENVKFKNIQTKENSSDAPSETHHYKLVATNQHDGEVWYKKEYPIDVTWWSKGKVDSYLRSFNLYGSEPQTEGVAHYDTITLKANSHGGYPKGYTYWWTYDFDDNDKFSVSRKPQADFFNTKDSSQLKFCFENALKALNISNEMKPCKVTLHWENKIDEDHKGNSDSIIYTVNVFPRAILPELKESDPVHTHMGVNMAQIQTTDDASFEVTAPSGGGDWSTHWSFNESEKKVENGPYIAITNMVLSADVAGIPNLFNGANDARSKNVYVSYVYETHNPADPSEIWEANSPHLETRIYNTPKAPTELNKKGSGNSNIYIAKMPVDDNFWQGNKYIFEFGDGAHDNVSGRETQQRWHQYSSSTSNPWVRTLWEYYDENKILEFTASEGYRNTKGELDPTRAETSIVNLSAEQQKVGYYVYTLNGNLLHSFSEEMTVQEMNLPAGIYLFVSCDGETTTSKKIMIK